MFSLDNYGGVLYRDSTPLLKFKFNKDSLIYVERLCDNEVLFPYELRNTDLSEHFMRLFLKNRTTPDTRQGIHEALKSTPIPYYNAELLLRYSKARTCDDNLWINPDKDISSLDMIAELYHYLFLTI